MYQDNNYIERVRFYGKHQATIKERELIFSSPNNDGSNKLNIICGKNRSGKSHLLQNISKCVFKHNEKIERNESYTQNKITVDDVDVFVKSYSSNLGSCLYIDDISRYIRYVRSISIRRNSSFRKKSNVSKRSVTWNQHLLKLCLDDFIRDILNKIVPIDFEKWDNEDISISDVYRESTYNNFDINNIYKCDVENELVTVFNESINAQLYFSIRKEGDNTTNYELYLAFNNETTLGFANWSQGQKVLFVTLLFVIYYKPNIFFFDEIENHLHPEYISSLFKFLKKNVPQAIISTHHPHIIFSKYVDSVWYLEIQKEPYQFPDILIKKNKNTNKAPFRKVYALDRNLEKLIYTYKLFDGYDNQLLRLSSSSLNDLNEKLVEVFKKLFVYEVVSSETKKTPDLQSEKIFLYLKEKLITQKSINVLEIGAGKARIIKELLKINPDYIIKNVNWFLLDPDTQVLNEEVNKLNIPNCHVTATLQSIDQNMDLILFINVLHELKPSTIASYIYELQKLSTKDTDILIVELYPLIFPEKFSIPMKSSEWAGLLRSIGMTVQVNSINIKNGYIEAFWLRSRFNNKELLPLEVIKARIDDFMFNNLLKNRCADYKARFSFGDFEDEMIRIMSELTTIASITSYNNGEWD